MPALAELFVRVRPDMSGFKGETSREVGRANLGGEGDKAGRHFGSKFNDSATKAIRAGAVGLAGAAAVGGLLAGKLIADSIKSASDLAETQSKIQVIFGKAAGAANQFGDAAARSMGQSKQEALDGLATFALYGKQAGLSGGSLLGFSKKFSTLASDMASFSNTSPQEAIEAIGAAFRGESDPIEKYGVLLNETTLKSIALKNGIIKTSTDALTPQQRVLAVQAALFEQLGKKGSGAIGDFARTSGGLANQQRILKADISNLKTEIGAGLLPIVQKFVTGLNTNVIPAVKAFAAQNKEGLAKALHSVVDAVQKLLPTAIDLGKWLITTAVPAFAAVAGAVGDTTGWLLDHQNVLKSLAIVVGGYVLILKGYEAGQKAAAVATKISSAAEVVNGAIKKANNSYLFTFIGVKALEFGAWVRSTAATVASTAATVAHTVVSKSARVATIAWTAVQWALNSAFLANPITLIVLLIVGLIAIIIQAYRHNETFRRIVQAVWAAIKVAIKAVADWFVNTLWPSLKRAYDQLTTAAQATARFVSGAWRTLRDGVYAAYVFVRDRIFSPLANYITKTIPENFRNGLAAVGRIWDGLKALAAKPVRFVVDTVINKGIVGTFNKISGFFHGPQLGTVSVPGLASGGRLPGKPSAVDNLLASGPGGKPIGLATGEYVVNARQTARNLPLLEAINSGRGFADGGLIGFIRNPAKWVSDRVGLGQIMEKANGSPFGRTLLGAGTMLKDALIARVKSFLDFGGGGSVSTGGLRTGILSVLASLRSTFGNVPIISGLRRGAFTLTGNRSLHASGRAIDIRPVREWAQYLSSTWGSRLTELITPWQEFNWYKGSRHRYTGAVWNQHNFPGGNAHIHAGYARGGLIGAIARMAGMRSFDAGGRWPSGTMGVNTSGRTEHVATGGDMDRMIALLEALLDAIDNIGPALGAELRGSASGMRHTARGVVRGRA